LIDLGCNLHVSRVAVSDERRTTHNAVIR